ncbi:MAG: transglutaminase family protein [Planctomycetota bacterium]
MDMIALQHRMRYRYEEPVRLGPHRLQLLPAARAPQEVLHWSVRVDPVPARMDLRWDALDNPVYELLFAEPLQELCIDCAATVRLRPVDPFAFLLAPHAAQWPPRYEDEERAVLGHYLQKPADAGVAQLRLLLAEAVAVGQPTTAALVSLNTLLYEHVGYVVRPEAGVQDPAHTLTAGCGSCRDSAWALVQLLRLAGVAARFVSGYLLHDDPAHPAELHAWCEACLPGAGWIGLDPSSGLLADRTHLPLCHAPDPARTAPVIGSHAPVAVRFDHGVALRPVEQPSVDWWDMPLTAAGASDHSTSTAETA